MATEELKIKISVDTSELKQGVNQAKQAISSLNDSTSKGIKSSVGGATASVEELKDTMQQIRNMDVASYVGKEFEKIKDDVSSAAAAIKKGFKDAGKWAKTAGKEFVGAFDFKNFEGADSFKDYVGSMATAAKDAASSVGQATKKIGAAFRTMANTVIESIGPALTKISLFAAAVASVAAIVNTFTTANHLKQLNAEAQKIGLSVNAYQEWGYVLDQVGVGADKLSDFIKTLTEEQLAVREGSEEMIRSFNELGLSANEVINMSQEDLFTETVKRLQNVRNETQRTSLAYQIFGEDAAELANVLRLTNSETTEMAATVHLLGNTISGGLLTKSQALSSAVSNLRMAWRGLTNTLAEVFMPIVTKVVEWLTKAIVVVNMFLKTIFNLDITPALSGVSDAVGGLGSYTDGLEGVGDAAGEAADAVEKLKKVTMGFDELNIVTNPNAAKKDSQSDSSSNGGGGLDFGSGLGDINTDESVFSKAQAQLEEFKAKIEEFIEKWKVQIGIIAGALAALSVANLISSLGQALGLGEKFLGIMTTIKKLAATAIIITLQYSLVNEFMDSYLDGAGFKEYLKGLLVAAIGTGVLYAMWGPVGLVIGLGVTAVASIKAVLDHGGITDVESLTVALTGLAAAIGAVSVAWKKLGIGAAVVKVAGEIGAFIALLKESGSLVGTLAAAFPGLATAIGKIGGALSAAGSAIASFAGSIGSALGLSGAAAVAAGAAIIVAVIAAIASAIYYAVENWEQVKAVAVGFFELNIAPKLESLKGAWDRLVEALVGVGDAFANLGKLIWDALPEGLKEWLADVWQGIKDVVAAIGEWFASINWLEAIGKVFEVIGGIIFHVLGSVVAGSFSAVVTVIEGFVTAISGVVEIVAGVVEAIVRLFTGDFQGALDAVKQIGQGIVDVFVGLYDMTIGPIVEFVKGIIDWFVALWDELVGHSIVPDMIDAIVEWFLSLPDKIFGAIEDFVKGILEYFKGLWNDLSSWFRSNIAPKFTKDYWKNKFDTIKQGASEKLEEAKKTISDKWSAIKSWFSTNVGEKFTKTYWKNKFDSIKQGASEKLNEVKSTITEKWNSIKTWFTTNVSSKFTTSYWTGKFNSIKDGAKAAFNGVISVVENAINGIIRKINTLSWKIPDWVPVFGGDTFGFNMKTISIPRLAEGGITNGSTLANIGERGREAVLPLEHNTQWMDRLADRIAARNSTPTKVVLQVGEKELGWATIGAINGITKQTGGLQLAL